MAWAGMQVGSVKLFLDSIGIGMRGSLAASNSIHKEKTQ